MGPLFGILLSLLSAVFKSGKSITTKYSVSSVGEYVTGWAFRSVSFVLFGVLLATPFFRVYLPISTTFWASLIINTLILSTTTLLITKAFRVSDISIISPLMALIPVMTVLPAWLLLQETPQPLGIVGIVFVTIGVYVLQVQTTAESYFEPLKRLRDDRGAKYIAIVLLLVSFTPAIDKIGLTHSTPLIWVFSTHLGMSIVLAGIMYHKESNISKQLTKNWKSLLLIGIMNSALWFVQIHAYELIYVSYVQAIKRVSILISIIAGYYLFDEEHIKARILGGSIILIGVICIILVA